MHTGITRSPSRALPKCILPHSVTRHAFGTPSEPNPKLLHFWRQGSDRHGNIGEFEGNGEDWVAYAERMEQYFAANAITVAATKRAVLLRSCGSATYKLIRSLTSPDKPLDISYEGLVTLVRDHYTPKPSVTVQRFKFNSRFQQSGESVTTYTWRSSGG